MNRSGHRVRLWQVAPLAAVVVSAVILTGSLDTSTGVHVHLVAASVDGTMMSDQADAPMSTGPLLNLDRLLPGGSATGLLSVEARTAGSVVLHEALSSNTRTALAVAQQLHLTITDLATGATVYTGSLGPVPDTAVCGTGHGPCPRWTSGETHPLVFLVSVPDATGNLFQDAGTTVVFTWSQQGRGDDTGDHDRPQRCRSLDTDGETPHPAHPSAPTIPACLAHTASDGATDTATGSRGATTPPSAP